MHAANEDGVNAPEEQDDHHYGGDLHNAQSLAAGLLNALDVLPPVIGGHRGREQGRSVVHIKLEWLDCGAHPSGPEAASCCAQPPSSISFIRPTMYCPADTPEIGPVRM